MSEPIIVFETMEPITLILPEIFFWLECVLFGSLGGVGLSLLNNGRLEKVTDTKTYIDLGWISPVYLGSITGIVIAGLNIPTYTAIIAGFVSEPLFKGLSKQLLKLLGITDIVDSGDIIEPEPVYDDK